MKISKIVKFLLMKKFKVNVIISNPIIPFYDENTLIFDKIRLILIFHC